MDNFFVSDCHSALSTAGVEMIFSGNRGHKRSRSSFEVRKSAPHNNGDMPARTTSVLRSAVA